MLSRSELSLLITLDISNRTELQAITDELQSFFADHSFWDQATLVWHFPERLLESKDFGPFMMKRFQAGDCFVSAGKTGTHHAVLNSRGLREELNDRLRPELTRSALFAPFGDLQRSECELMYRSLEIPCVIGSIGIAPDKHICAFASGTQVSAPVSALALDSVKGARALRSMGLSSLRRFARCGRYGVLHVTAHGRQDLKALLRFFEATEKSRRFRHGATFVNLRFPTPLQRTPHPHISPLYTPRRAPCLPEQIHTALHNDQSRHRSPTDSVGIDTFQAVAGMQGEASLKEGDLELLCIEGAPSEIRHNGVTLLHGNPAIGRVSYRGAASYPLRAVSVVSIESDQAWGLDARFAAKEASEDEIVLSVRYLFFENCPHLFIETDLWIESLQSQRPEVWLRSFLTLGFRPASGTTLLSTHPISGHVSEIVPQAPRTHRCTSLLTVQKQHHGVTIGAAPFSSTGSSPFLYTLDQELYLGSCHGPTAPATLSKLSERRLLVIGISSLDSPAVPHIPQTVMARLHTPSCYSHETDLLTDPVLR